MRILKQLRLYFFSIDEMTLVIFDAFEILVIQKTTNFAVETISQFLLLNKNIADFKCSGLSKDQSEALLRAAVGLISVPVEPDALNAILRLCLRLTRTFSQAR